MTTPMSTWRVRAGKAVLVTRLWAWLLVIQVMLRRLPLPRVVAVLCRPPRRRRHSRLGPFRLGGFVYRRLRLGPYRPRCLLRALVHLRMLRAQGLAAQLVIGLPERPTSKDAHAWVEIDGAEVGPPPGRNGHVELVRYPPTPSRGADEAPAGRG